MMHGHNESKSGAWGRTDHSARWPQAPGPIAARVLCVGVVLLIAPYVHAAEPPEAVTIDGPAFRAAPAAITAAGEIRWQGDLSPTPPGALVEWGAPAEVPAASHVVLPGGGVIPAGIGALANDDLRLETTAFGGQSLRLGLLAGLVFTPPADPDNRDRLLLRIARAEGASDVVILVNGDEVTGTLLALDRDGAQVQSDIGPVKIERAKLAAIVLNPTARERPAGDASRIWVGLADGTRLPCTSVELAEGRLTLKLPGGVELATDAKNLVWLHGAQLLRGVWLTDLSASDYRHIPYLELSWPYEIDANVTGGPLRVRGRVYHRGVGMHSAARLTYPLDGAYRRFEALLAIDDSAGGRGSVTFRVYVDDRQAYKSPEITGDRPPVPISVDVTGGKLLSLIVDFGRRADELDHAAWLNPRLLK